ncbi:MAG TPA: hypothetical protein DCP91_01435 [Eggerthellaceae bacterium]|nr:hypothetical protein [Eggerthellaceae bacterium]
MGFGLKKAKALWEEFSGIAAETHASSIAYFVFLSLIPLLTLNISIATMAGLDERQVVEFFSAIAPDTFDDFAKTLIGDAYKQSGLAFSLSTVTLLWTASRGIKALHSGLTAAYGVQEQRGPVAVAVICMGMAIILGILLAATIFLVFGGPVLRAMAWLVPGLEQRGDVLNALNAAAMAVLGTVALGLCYTYLPDGSRRFAAQLPGAVIASLSCGVLTLGFHVYVDNFCNSEALYGSIATIALFLFWMFLVSQILIVGAFLNRVRASSSS